MNPKILWLIYENYWRIYSIEDDRERFERVYEDISLVDFRTGFDVTFTLIANFNSLLNASHCVIFSSTAILRTFQINSKNAIKIPVHIPKPTSKKTPPTLDISSSAAPPAESLLSLVHFPIYVL